MKKRRLAPLRGDRSLWIIVSVLLVFSLMVIYSSTVSKAYVDASGDTSYFMLRQAKFILFSFLLMVFVHWIDFKVYAKYIRTIFYLSVILVIATMFVGESRNEAARWIPVPFFGRFQPSEMLKIALVMLLAVQLGARSAIISHIPITPALTPSAWQRNPQKNRDIWNKTTKPLVLPIAISCMVILPMNLSTAVVLFMVSMIIFLIGQVRVREIGRIVMVGGAALMLIVGTMTLLGVGRAETWINRIENFVSPIVGHEKQQTSKDRAENFQKEQAKIAIASGGAIGKGPGNSTQRSQLPHPYSDYAYAFIIEEYGAVGGVVVFLLFLWIFYRAGVIAHRCRNATTALLVIGLSLSITVQAFVNMLVCVGLFPVTGQPLPLISMGGSSVLFTCLAFGVMLSVSRQNNEEDRLEALAARQVAGSTEMTTEVEEAEDQQQQHEEAYAESDNNYLQESDEMDDLPDEESEEEEEDSESEDEDEDDDFPFVVVEHDDGAKVIDTKAEKNVVDLY